MRDLTAPSGMPHSPHECRGLRLGMIWQVDETTPRECPRGHQLGPRRVLVGWLPCLCQLARESGNNGHRTHDCNACHDEGYRAIRYDPPHIRQDLDIARIGVHPAASAGLVG